jgi:hypothetical protein
MLACLCATALAAQSRAVSTSCSFQPSLLGSPLHLSFGKPGVQSSGRTSAGQAKFTQYTCSYADTVTASQAKQRLTVEVFIDQPYPAALYTGGEDSAQYEAAHHAARAFAAYAPLAADHAYLYETAQGAVYAFAYVGGAQVSVGLVGRPVPFAALGALLRVVVGHVRVQAAPRSARVS